MCLAQQVRGGGVAAPLASPVATAYIHWINHYAVDNGISFPNAHPLDGTIQLLNNRGQEPVSQKSP